MGYTAESGGRRCRTASIVRHFDRSHSAELKRRKVCELSTAEQVADREYELLRFFGVTPFERLANHKKNGHSQNEDYSECQAHECQDTKYHVDFSVMRVGIADAEYLLIRQSSANLG